MKQSKMLPYRGKILHILNTKHHVLKQTLMMFKMAIRWGFEGWGDKGENKIWWVGMFCKRLNRGNLVKNTFCWKKYERGREKSHTSKFIA